MSASRQSSVVVCSQVDILWLDSSFLNYVVVYFIFRC